MDIRTWFYLIYVIISIIYIIRFFIYHHKLGVRYKWSFGTILTIIFAICFILFLWPFLLINDIVLVIKIVKFKKYLRRIENLIKSKYNGIK